VARRATTLGQRGPDGLVPLDRRRRAVQGHPVSRPPPARNPRMGPLGRHELRRPGHQRLGDHGPHGGGSTPSATGPHRPAMPPRNRCRSGAATSTGSSACPDAQIRVLLQRTDDPKVSKERMHLDLESDDVEAEVQRLEALGATRSDHQQERGYDFWVMRDPWAMSSASSSPSSPNYSAGEHLGPADPPRSPPGHATG